MCAFSRARVSVGDSATRIQARYMSGDKVTLAPCSTINDVRVDIAGRHDKFAPDVAVMSADFGLVFTDDDAAPPPEVAIAIKGEAYDDARWRAAVTAHAKAQDAHGVRRAMEKVECDGGGSGAVICSKALSHLASDGGPTVARGASTLIECGADVNYEPRKGRMTSLMVSAGCGDAEIVLILIAAAANINHATRMGRTALIDSASQGCAAVAQVLISAAADINHVDKISRTALTVAVDGGHMEIVQMLIAAAVNINHEACGGRTALIDSAAEGRAAIAQVLISAAADINHVDKMNETALTRSAEGGHAQVARMLISAAADINYENKRNRSALTISADRGHAGVVQMLIYAAADITHADADKCTALMIAAERGHAEVAQILANAEEHTHWFPIAQYVTRLYQTCSGA